MREIKFRVWDGDGFISEESDRSRGDFFISADGRVWQRSIRYLLDGGGDGRVLDETDSIHQRPDWVACQYTGLKDANGTEIYEGDILRFALSSEAEGVDPRDDADSVDSRFVVRWGDYGEGREYEPGERGNIGYGWFIEHEGVSDPITTGWFFTVIGNIYEHPELMEV